MPPASAVIEHGCWHEIGVGLETTAVLMLLTVSAMGAAGEGSESPYFQ
jgi:hypothetical protein